MIKKADVLAGYMGGLYYVEEYAGSIGVWI